ncbi:MAG: hypothetical protein GY749_03450 [Desulfobacteraceae bacterium]|nr:hypothetical protein [Desulfobacteraceae bacterium]
MYLDSWNKMKIIGSVATPGQSFGVTVAGNKAYVADGYRGLQIIDISDPENPQVTGSASTSGTAYNVTVAEDKAYVACGRGLQIIDISDSKNPLTIGFVKTASTASDVKVADDKAYIACGRYSKKWRGIQIADISNSKKPLIIGSVETPENVKALTVVDNMVYAACGDLFVNGGFRVVDITDSEQPQLIGYIEIPGMAYDVAVSDDKAYVTYIDITGPDGLKIIDISNPDNLQIIGSWDERSGDIYGVTVEKDKVFITDGACGIRIIDVSCPEQPRSLGVVYSEGPSDVTVEDGKAYVIKDSGGLNIIDISKPEKSQNIASVDTPVFALDVTVSGNTAYVTEGYGGGLQLIDIENQEITGKVESPDQTGFFEVKVKENRAYVSCNDYSQEKSYLRIIDISNPADPYIIDSVDMPFNIKNFVITENMGFAAIGGIEFGVIGGGLQIIDLNDSKNPQIISSVETPKPAIAVAVADERVYLSDAEKKVRIIDISNPEYPQFAGLLNTIGLVTSFFVAENNLYLMSFVSGQYGRKCLQVVDIEDPDAPENIGFFYGSDDNFGRLIPRIAAVANNKVYLMSPTNGITVVDVSNPEHITFLRLFSNILIYKHLITS